MQRVFAIIALLCCTASICRANAAPQAWVNAVDTNAMEKVLLGYTDNVGVLTYSTTMVPRRLFSIKYFVRYPVIPSWLIPTRGYGINGEYGSLRRNWDGFESRYLHQWEREIVAD